MTDLMNDNAIPLLEALGWSDFWFSPDGEMFGIPPEEQTAGIEAERHPVPLALIENFIEPTWKSASQPPRLYCLVETPRGEIVKALYVMGSFEMDGQEIQVTRWLPWQID